LLHICILSEQHNKNSGVVTSGKVTHIGIVVLHKEDNSHAFEHKRKHNGCLSEQKVNELVIVAWRLMVLLRFGF